MYDNNVNVDKTANLQTLISACAFDNACSGAYDQCCNDNICDIKTARFQLCTFETITEETNGCTYQKQNESGK